MSTSCVRSIGLAMLVLFSAILARAESFSGPTYIDFNSRGPGTYDLEFFASAVLGGETYGWAYASFGSLYTTGESNYGESGAGYRLNGIHKVGSQWIAAHVWKYQFVPGGYWETTYYSNVVVPSAGWVDGTAYVYSSPTYSQTVTGYISKY